MPKKGPKPPMFQIITGTDLMKVRVRANKTALIRQVIDIRTQLEDLVTPDEGTIPDAGRPMMMTTRSLFTSIPNTAILREVWRRMRITAQVGRKQFAWDEVASVKAVRKVTALHFSLCEAKNALDRALKVLEEG